MVLPLARVAKDAVRPTGDVDRDLRSAQFGEGLGIQDQEERAFLLHAETDTCTICFSCGLFSVSIKKELTSDAAGPMWPRDTCLSGRDDD